MKTAQNFLDEANEVVPKISVEEAKTRHGTLNSVFIDVRDSSEIAQSGTVKDALRIPRGFIEFVADDNTKFHNEKLSKDADIFLVCGAGGQAALAGKTLKDMGFTSVINIGGFGDWKEAGGPVDDPSVV